jgi:hypothetical protein
VCSLHSMCGRTGKRVGTAIGEMGVVGGGASYRRGKRRNLQANRRHIAPVDLSGPQGGATSQG